MTLVLPLRLGFFLELRNVTFQDMPGHYRGVDRLWFTPELDDDGTIPNVSDELREIWERYFDANFQSGSYLDLAVAQGLASALAQHGVHLEVICVEILGAPGSVKDYAGEKRIRQFAGYEAKVHDSVSKVINHMEFLGYDVSLPFPSFHSAIFQPGLDKASISLSATLNDNGLIGDAEVAALVCGQANLMDYGPRPFCVLGVWGMT